MTGHAAGNAVRSALVALAVLAAACCDSAADQAPAIPFPNVSHMRPEFAALVTKTHDALLADDSAAAWQRHGRALMEAGESAEAEQVLLRAAAMPGNDRPGCLHAAGVAAAGVDRERAILHFRAALDAGGNAPSTHLRLAVMLEQLGRFDEAEQEYRAVEKAGPSSHALLGLGRIALARGDTGAAIDLLRRARYVDEGHVEVAIALAQAYNRAGDTQRAERFARLIRSAHDVTPVPDPYLHEFVFGADAR